MSDLEHTHLDTHTLTRLLDVAKQLSAPGTLNQMLSLVVDAGRDVLGADRGTVFLFDKPRNQLFAAVATGEKEIRFSIDTGIAGQCARDLKIIHVQDCYADARFNQAIDKQTGYHTSNLIALPLVDWDDKLVGVLQLLNLAKSEFDALDQQLAQALAGLAGVAIQRARLLEDRLSKLKLEADLDLARQIQQGVLPDVLPACAGYDLAHFSRPADQTGGDIYDVLSLGSNNLLFFLADATGHGIGPALSVTQARAMLRIAMRYDQDLDKSLLSINDQLVEDLASNRFITAFLGILDPQLHQLTYHAPGQGPLLHFQAASGRCNWFPATLPPLGIMQDPPMDQRQVIDLAPGDIFALLTDGFYEYQNPQQALFGQDRVGEIIHANCKQSAQQITQTLVDAVVQFGQSQPQGDDLTALVIKRL